MHHQFVWEWINDVDQENLYQYGQWADPPLRGSVEDIAPGRDNNASHPSSRQVTAQQHDGIRNATTTAAPPQSSTQSSRIILQRDQNARVAGEETPRFPHHTTQHNHHPHSPIPGLPRRLLRDKYSAQLRGPDLFPQQQQLLLAAGGRVDAPPFVYDPLQSNPVVPGQGTDPVAVSYQGAKRVAGGGGHQQDGLRTFPGMNEGRQRGPPTVEGRTTTTTSRSNDWRSPSEARARPRMIDEDFW